MAFEGDWLRPVISGLVGAAVVFALAAFTMRAPPDRAGWRQVAPSPMHWTAVALGSGMVVLMGYVRLFVGSARADAEQQMTILSWLIAAFALGTIGSALSMLAIRRRAIRWRGRRVLWRHRRREVEADLAALAAIGRDWLGHVVLRFEDGTVLRIDPYARGASQLLEAADEQLWPDEDPAERRP